MNSGTQAILKQMERISIRGRFAYAMATAELILTNPERIVFPFLEIYLDHLWELTNSTDFAAWHAKMEVLRPSKLGYYLQYWEEEEAPVFSINEMQQFAKTVDKLPKEARWALNAACEIAERHLYTSVDGKGISSLYVMEAWLNSLDQRKGPYLSLEPFLAFAITEKAGWGRLFRRKDIQRISEGLG